MGKILFCLAFLFIAEISGAQQTIPPATKKLRYISLCSSLTAIASDWFVEFYYTKYKEAEEPSDCEKYRESTKLYENIRDISMWTAGISLAASIISEKFAKQPKSQGAIQKLHINLGDKELEVTPGLTLSPAKKGIGLSIFCKRS
ncbi:MAG: hypothetical protein PHX21_02845 [bacterium]|nr:hypothetical protein [bacterium]